MTDDTTEESKDRRNKMDHKSTDPESCLIGEDDKKLFGWNSKLLDIVRNLKGNDPDYDRLSLDLEVYHAGLTAWAWERLGSYVSKCTYLKHIELSLELRSRRSFPKLNDGLSAFFQAAAEDENTTITSFSLYSNGRHSTLVFQGLKYFLQALTNLKEISLELDSDEICKKFDVLEIIFEALNESAVESCEFRQCCIAGDISVFERFNLPELKILDLSHNNIGIDGCMVIANMLRLDESTLEVLNLEYNDIGKDCVELLAKSLLKNSTLEKLLLWGNPGGGRQILLNLVTGVINVGSPYEANHTIQEIDINPQDENMAAALEINCKYKGDPEGAACAKVLWILKENPMTADILEEKDDILEEKEEKIDTLKTSLEKLTKNDTVDLTNDDAHQASCDSNNEPNDTSAKRQRTDECQLSGLAILHKQSQEMVKVKEEAMERIETAEKEVIKAKEEAMELVETAEKKAAVALQERENAELRLECPICREVEQDSCALVPCGHTLCSTCAKRCGQQNCPTCRRAVTNHFKLFR